MLAVSKAGQAHDDAASIRAPVRSEESGEGRHDINATIVLNFAREVFDGRSVGDDLQVIAQPLHQGTAHGYRTLEGIHGALALALEADGGQQAVLGELRGGTRIQQEEQAGSVGILCGTCAEATLAEHRGLLVT